jgi:hypothetical protein
VRRPHDRTASAGTSAQEPPERQDAGESHPTSKKSYVNVTDSMTFSSLSLSHSPATNFTGHAPVSDHPTTGVASCPAVCQRQREKPVRLLDASPERLDTHLWPGYQDRLLSRVFRALSDQRRAGRLSTLRCWDPILDPASGRHGEIPVRQPPAVLARHRPVGAEASLERSRLGGRELRWNMLARAKVHFVRGLPAEG